MSPPTVLVTGAAGTIGSRFSRTIAPRFRLRLADLAPDGLPAIPGTESIHLDVRDAASCARACEGVDVVVHLAADPSTDAPFHESLLHTNIEGTYNVFQAAKDAGCARVVFASSINVMSGYPLDVQAHPETPVRPGNVHGVSKSFGEALAAYFAFVEGLSSIVVRIGFYCEDLEAVVADARTLSAFVDPDDLCDLLERCIVAENVEFAIVHGVSNNRFKRLDLTSTRRLLGYHPTADAFRVFGTGLRYRDRWDADPDTGRREA